GAAGAGSGTATRTGAPWATVWARGRTRGPAGTAGAAASGARRVGGRNGLTASRSARAGADEGDLGAGLELLRRLEHAALGVVDLGDADVAHQLDLLADALRHAVGDVLEHLVAEGVRRRLQGEGEVARLHLHEHALEVAAVEVDE